MPVRERARRRGSRGDQRAASAPAAKWACSRRSPCSCCSARRRARCRPSSRSSPCPQLAGGGAEVLVVRRRVARVVLVVAGRRPRARLEASPRRGVAARVLLTGAVVVRVVAERGDRSLKPIEEAPPSPRRRCRRTSRCRRGDQRRAVRRDRRQRCRRLATRVIPSTSNREPRPARRGTRRRRARARRPRPSAERPGTCASGRVGARSAAAS